MVTKVTAFFCKYMIASAHCLKLYSGAYVNPAPVSWPANGPKRLGIHLARCGKPNSQWLRQTNLKQSLVALLFDSINEICSRYSTCNLLLYFMAQFNVYSRYTKFCVSTVKSSALKFFHPKFNHFIH